MKNIIIVRHGKYGRDGNLNEEGQSQIRSLAENIREHLGYSNIIISSPAPIARQSADILADIFGITLEEHKVLYSKGYESVNLGETFELIESKKEVDTIIVVTHLEYTEELPSCLANELFRKKIESEAVEKGHAWLLDCIDETLTYVRD